jgi:hypothetical protein
MSLTLTLLMLARQAAGAPLPPAPTDAMARPVSSDGAVMLEVLSADASVEPAWCAAEVDSATDELVIRSSPRSWDRVQAAFDAPAPGEMVRILLPQPGSATRMAGLVRSAHPHLDVVDDARTNTILVSGGRRSV